MPLGLRAFAANVGAEASHHSDVVGDAREFLYAGPVTHAAPLRLAQRRLLSSFLVLDSTEPPPLLRAPRRRTSFVPQPGVRCDFEDMKSCHTTSGQPVPCPELPKDWVKAAEEGKEGKTLEDFYKTKGLKSPDWYHYFWPGKAGKGECNDASDRRRGCWYKTRLRAATKCGEKEHCIAVAPQDGEHSHRLSCPAWIRNKDGELCEVPDGWQACPIHFTMKRFNTKVPDKFFTAILTPCKYAESPDQNCLTTGFNPTDPYERDALKETGFYFDLGMNKWYRCTPWMFCQKYEIKQIYDPQTTDGKCGEETCREGDDCFVHEDFGTKKLSHHCVPGWNTYIISDASGVLED